MDIFLDTFISPKLIHVVINLNRVVTRIQVELVIKPIPQRKNQDNNTSLINSTKHLKKTYSNIPQDISNNRKGRSYSELFR